MLQELAAATGKRIVFYCAFGERSAMAGRRHRANRVHARSRAVQLAAA